MAQRDDSKPKQRRRSVRGVFERPRGSGVWWVRYHDEHGREHREKAGPKGLANDLYQKRKNEVRERRFFPETIRHREVLLSDVIDDYLKRMKGHLRSYRDYKRYGDTWKEVLRGKTLAQVVPGDIERYIAKRRSSAKPATTNRELAFLKRVFNVAIADGKTERNPARAVRLRKENNARVRFLTDEEEQALREAIGEAEWPTVAVALHTGLRQAEQFKLRWQDVDFGTGIITVARSKHGETRRVPMNDTVRAILTDRFVRADGKFVFVSTTATALDACNYMRRVFVPAVKAAGIENFHWHDLRHSFASRLTMAGVDLRTVQELMGHKTITMTLRYAHLSPAHQLDAVQKLNRETGTTTGTSEGPSSGPDPPPSQVPDLVREKGAGARIRTADLLITKPILGFFQDCPTPATNVLTS